MYHSGSFNMLSKNKYNKVIYNYFYKSKKKNEG